MNRAESYPHKVIAIEHVTNTSFILRIERNNMEFRTGQHINVGPPESEYTREYSIYSSEHDNYLEVLIKEVSNGFISPLLKNVKTGDTVMVEPPLGYFFLPGKEMLKKKYLFVATGTGIAPFHSFIKSWSDLDYKLIHGIPDASESIHKEFYSPGRLVLCTSRSTDGQFQGRVTQWLEKEMLNNYDHIYLCGNRNMINDAHKILTEKGINADSVHAEAYF